jgi:type IV pilus assembly protein PilY1
MRVFVIALLLMPSVWAANLSISPVPLCSATSLAADAAYLDASVKLYQARFDRENWTGQLLAYGVNTVSNVGTLTDIEWDAACELTGGACAATGSSTSGLDWDTGREIISSTDNGMGVAFRWSNISPSQQVALGISPDTGASDGLGSDRLDYIRGRSHASMRNRGSLLGDIVGSGPVFVGAPPYAYPDSLETPPYSTYLADQQTRTPMVYVGANDGMLHGFSAVNGQEKIAYVPSKVYKNLPALTSNHYGSATVAHRYFVDAPPSVGDVVINGSWKTVLVGGLGYGGQGLYALDVTNPSNFDELNAGSLVLWEFTDANDADLGFTYGQPAVVRLANGAWAAVIGNGYNNTQADSHPSSTGNAVIYILDITDGSVIKKFDTGKDGGIATVTPVDVNADHIVDYIYAGDLLGHIWKLDVTHSNPGNWAFAGGSTRLLFESKNSQGDVLPITSAIEVGLHPTLPGQMVYWGTGKYLETTDASAIGQDTQAVFGVWDRNESTLSTITRTHLLQQTINQESSFDDSEVRVTSAHAIQWYTGFGTPASPASSGYLGWYMDLYNTENGNTQNKGERVIVNPVLSDGRLTVVTLLPSDVNCDGASSWLMTLDAQSGARTPAPVLDINGDGVVTADDRISEGSTVASGLKSEQGILSAPITVKDSTAGMGNSGRAFNYTSGSSGDIQVVTENRSASAVVRQSWRRID